MTHNAERKDAGKDLSLIGLAVGLATGVVLYAIVEFWINDHDYAPTAYAALFAVVTASAAFLLLFERDQLLKAVIAALAVAAVFLFPDYHMAAALGDETNRLTNFPPLFWFMASRSVAAYLLIVLVKAVMEDGAPPPYRGVFFHGLTLPLIAAGANLFAALALVLLFAWARLLKEMDVNFFNKYFQEPWFILPFLGAVGGLSLALMRGQDAALGALRYILLLFSRIAVVITAIATLTFLIVLATKGPEAIFSLWRPSLIMTGLAVAGMLIVNGVYQNGEGAPPPLWLRIPTLITLIGFPVYAWLAFYAFWVRVEAYGLTPPRIAGLTVIGVVSTYAVVCLAGLATEINWRGKKWMPVVGPFNTAMAALWIVILVALATPLANPWAISAQSQYDLLAKGRVTAANFDYGYLHFELGPYGEKALDRLLALQDRPDAADIRLGVARARTAQNRWEYDHPDAPKPTAETAPVEDGAE